MSRVSAVRTIGLQSGSIRPGWPGVVEAYRAHLPVSAATPVVTLLEGNTPLIPSPALSKRAGAAVAPIAAKM
jgi:threonine synthase